MILERDRVFQQVRTDILNCELKPGEELREADLAKRYGVSKTPIRDAMQKLEHEGLVDIEPRRGHRVRPISMRDAEDILELRAILESAVVGKVARTASAEDLASLDQLRSADVGSVDSFAEYNRLFHTTLAAMSGNRRLAEETVRVMEFYDRLAIVSLTLYAREGGFDGPLADHNSIIDALQARNGRLAGRLVREHVERSRGQIMRGLIRQPVIA
jgi:GntR family transcriptional regulator, rspAB operon transcriptional repressor